MCMSIYFEWCRHGDVVFACGSATARVAMLSVLLKKVSSDPGGKSSRNLRRDVSKALNSSETGSETCAFAHMHACMHACMYKRTDMRT